MSNNRSINKSLIFRTDTCVLDKNPTFSIEPPQMYSSLACSQISKENLIKQF